MEIAALLPVAVGTAVDISLNVDAKTSWLRLLRKTGPNANFSGPADPDAFRVIDASITPASQTRLFSSLLDTDVLDQHVYTYMAFAYRAPEWLASATRDITVNPTLQDDPIDVVDYVVQRIDVGLQNELRAGRLQSEHGIIPVFTGPPQSQTPAFPLVTVHCDAITSDERAIGEHIAPDLLDTPGPPEHNAGQWLIGEGWLSKISITITGYSLNLTERTRLRSALRRIIQGNLQIFSSVGMFNIDFSQHDQEDFESYNVPIYMTVGTFTAVSPEIAIGTTHPIDNTDTQVITYEHE